MDNNTYYLNGLNKEKIKRVVVHQPNLFPNIKVLQKICSGDLWVILDDVQFVRREWQNRCKVRHLKDSEKEFWITANISKTSQKEKINKIKFKDYNEFKKVTIQQMRHLYRKSRNWYFIEELINKAFKNEYHLLSDFCVNSIMTFLNMINIRKTIAYSSNFDINYTKTKRLVELCKIFNATSYISGLAGKSYMDMGLFSKENILVEWHEWQQPCFESEDDQLDWRNFSFIDFIARYNISEVQSYLLNSKRDRINETNKIK
ncbi:WbqC family protein [Bacillus amyloliquefaciens]|uniref:WbqC family protein n=1 Tax=Bacillus amyloliquefaciens TaxID=1390 RepID=UPI0022AFD0D4|nr:WbqC family protein [Bacillus amyloliquefaciens]MCZ4247795.1 WbqC family protein [Bacillus amyloliquefaciens]